ncbi:MAG: HD domain-containing protein [Niabella sp.]|nr:MAG: HD domain-containing protein [Niabella sp.]
MNSNQNLDHKTLKRILYLIEQAGSLMLLPRTHIKHLGNSFDNIASHSYQVAVVAYCISRMEHLTHEEALQSVGMAIFHDLSEARTGDLDFIAKHYATVDENKAVQDQLKGVPFSSEIKVLIDEYNHKRNNIAICARDADSLVQFYTQWVLMWQGNQLAKKWYDSDFNDRIPGLKTESARHLALALKDSNPNEWWWSQFLENDAAIEKDKLLGKDD